MSKQTKPMTCADLTQPGDCQCELALTFGGGPFALDGRLGLWCGDCVSGLGTKADCRRAWGGEQINAVESNVEGDNR